jgi:hypothetical protein
MLRMSQLEIAEPPRHDNERDHENDRQRDAHPITRAQALLGFL